MRIHVLARVSQRILRKLPDGRGLFERTKSLFSGFEKRVPQAEGGFASEKGFVRYSARLCPEHGAMILSAQLLFYILKQASARNS